MSGWLLLVYPATVMLRQHYLIDVYAGVFIGFAVYWAVMFVVERPRLVPRDDDLVMVER
jgi:membrane-associated phospholipid phosphatase